MQDEIKVWLEDIEKAISEINDFLPEPRNFLEFGKDTKTKRAVERNIGIIGEAMSRILNLEPNIAISESRKIVDTRNRIVHGYDSVIAVATFDPDARLNWHTHPGGQILLFTEGTGFYQERGKAKQVVRKGDVIKCLPDVEHWKLASISFTRLLTPN